MKRKILIGIATGTFAGIIDVIPMVIQNLTWDANLSAFSMWILIGFFVSVAEIGVRGVLKGLIISYLLIIPVSFIIGWKEPFSLVPILVMTTILGGLVGYLVNRIVKSEN